MKEAKNLLVVTVSGKDRPGITAAFTRVFIEHSLQVLDIEQASLQNLLGLYFLLDLSSVTETKDSVIKDLLFEVNRLSLTLNFQLISPIEIQTAIQRNLYVLTHFGDTKTLAELSNILGEENVSIKKIWILSRLIVVN